MISKSCSYETEPSSYTIEMEEINPPTDFQNTETEETPTIHNQIIRPPDDFLETEEDFIEDDVEEISETEIFALSQQIVSKTITEAVYSELSSLIVDSVCTNATEQFWQMQQQKNMAARSQNEPARPKKPATRLPSNFSSKKSSRKSSLKTNRSSNSNLMLEMKLPGSISPEKSHSNYEIEKCSVPTTNVPSENASFISYCQSYRVADSPDMMRQVNGQKVYVNHQENLNVRLDLLTSSDVDTRVDSRLESPILQKMSALRVRGVSEKVE